MATSSKVQFKLSTLKTKAIESIDFRIEQAQREVDSYDNEAILLERIAEWRTRQEERISELFSQLGEGGIGDHQLAKWKIQPIPEIDQYGRGRAETALRRLEATRSKIMAKADSLVPDEEGNISLTKTQLEEFFGL
jgi:hypothetical protein